MTDVYDSFTAAQGAQGSMLFGRLPLSVSDRLPSQAAQHAYVERVAARLGLQIQATELTGPYVTLMDETGVKLRRHPVYAYADATPEDVAKITVKMLEYIVEKHGTGRVWFLNHGPHIISDDPDFGQLCEWFRTADGSVIGPRMRMRMFYCHEKQAEEIAP